MIRVADAGASNFRGPHIADAVRAIFRVDRQREQTRERAQGSRRIWGKEKKRKKENFRVIFKLKNNVGRGKTRRRSDLSCKKQKNREGSGGCIGARSSGRKGVERKSCTAIEEKVRREGLPATRLAFIQRSFPQRKPGKHGRLHRSVSSRTRQKGKR